MRIGRFTIILHLLIAVLLITLSVVSFSTISADSPFCGEGTVARKDGRSLREGPGLDHDLITVIPYNSIVMILKCDSVTTQEDGRGYEWVEVQTQEGAVGWMALHPIYFQINEYSLDSPAQHENSSTIQDPKQTIFPENTSAESDPQETAHTERSEATTEQANYYPYDTYLDYDPFWTFIRVIFLIVFAAGVIKFFSGMGIRVAGIILVVVTMLCCGGDWYINARTHCQPTGYGDAEASFAMDLTPIVGDFKGIKEGIEGCDAVTGDKLGPWRWFGFILLSEVRVARPAVDGTFEILEAGGKSAARSTRRYFDSTFETTEEGLESLAKHGKNSNVVESISASSHRSRLRSALGGVIGDHKQAHHIIPLEHIEHYDFVKRAQQAGWDPDAAYNGILLPDNPKLAQEMWLPWHQGSHPNYSNEVKDSLDNLEDLAKVERWTGEEAFERLLELADNQRDYLRKLGPVQLK